MFVNFVNNAKDSCRTLHNVAFQSRSILPTTYKFLPLSVLQKTERKFSNMKVMKNLVRSTTSGEPLEDLIELAASTGFVRL